MKTVEHGTFGQILSGACFLALICANTPVSVAQEQTLLTCVAAGRDYSIGEIACIPACHGQQRLAKCERTDRGVDWTSISDNCPAAMNSKPRDSASIL
jgi:hypothetical protein